MSIAVPVPKRCSTCGKVPFYDILTRDTIGRLMEGRCNEPSVAQVSCCGLVIKALSLQEAVDLWNANNP